jgi:hypothetical protein
MRFRGISEKSLATDLANATRKRKFLLCGSDETIQPCFSASCSISVDDAALGRLVDGRDKPANTIRVCLFIATGALLQRAQTG